MLQRRENTSLRLPSIAKYNEISVCFEGMTVLELYKMDRGEWGIPAVVNPFPSVFD